MMANCDHDWQVYSTAIATGCLMLSCPKCGADAIVAHPTRREWRRAWYAPSMPYRWDGAADRVTIVLPATEPEEQD